MLEPSLEKEANQDRLHRPSLGCGKTASAILRARLQNPITHKNVVSTFSGGFFPSTSCKYAEVWISQAIGAKNQPRMKPT